MTISPSRYGLLGKKREPLFKKGGLSYVLVGLVAWLSSSVITALCFGHFYLLGTIASWILIPLATLMIFVGWVSVFLFGFAPQASALLNSLNAQLALRSISMVEEVNASLSTKVSLRGAEYHGKVTIFDLGKGKSALYLGAVPGRLLQQHHNQATQQLLEPLLQRAALWPVRSGEEEWAFSKRSSTSSASDLPERRYVGKGFTLTRYLAVGQSARADDRGIPVKIEKHGWSVLYLGELGIRSVAALQRRADELKADLLIVGEHSYGEEGLAEFCELVKPRLVIRARPYFHRESPARVLGVDVLGQERMGAVRLDFRPESLVVHCKNGAKRVIEH